MTTDQVPWIQRIPSLLLKERISDKMKRSLVHENGSCLDEKLQWETQGNMIQRQGMKIFI